MPQTRQLPGILSNALRISYYIENIGILADTFDSHHPVDLVRTVEGMEEIVFRSRGSHWIGVSRPDGELLLSPLGIMRHIGGRAQKKNVEKGWDGHHRRYLPWIWLWRWTVVTLCRVVLARPLETWSTCPHRVVCFFFLLFLLQS